MDKTHNFTEGKILKPLLLFALPIFLALFLQAMYGAVDLLVVGRFATTEDVSAVATGSMLMQSITVALSSLSMGLTIFLGQVIGEKKLKEVGKIIGSGIILFSGIAIVLTIILCFSSETIASLLHAPSDAYSQTVSYIRICSLGITFIIAFNTLGGIFRGIGDSTMPLITVAIACVFNIILDLLFVYEFNMGASGAALATIFAQAISVIISILIIKFKGIGISFSMKDIKWNKKYIHKILGFGVPVAVQDLLVNVSFLVIMAIVNNLGLEESAGVGVAEKVCAFLMLVPSAYMQSLAAFVAQNAGAKKYSRAKKSLLYAIGTSLIAGVVMGYLGFFHGDMLASIFDNDPVVIKMAADYLKAYGIDCLFTTILFCMNGFYSGMGHTTFVMIQGIIGALGIRITVSYIMSKLEGTTLFHIGLATPISSFVQITICIVFFIVLLKQSKRVEG